MKRKTSVVLMSLIAATLFTPLLTPEVAANPGRDINIYVIKASDSYSSWIGNVNKVQEGIEAARNDAISRTGVILTGESINSLQLVTSSNDLLQLALNPPEHAIFINTHGETVPIPTAYTQNDAGTGGDASDNFNSAITLWGSQYTGYMADSDTNDWYAQYFVSGDGMRVTLTSPSGSNFDVETYDHTGWYHRASYVEADGQDTAHIPIDSTGYWRVRILLRSGFGDYTFRIDHAPYPPPPPPGGGCPFVSSYNGTSYVLDNNILPAAESSNGTDGVDYYMIQQAVTPREDGIISFLLSEFENEYDFLDKVQLLAVDRSSAFNLAVSPNGEIMTYANPSPPVSAIDNTNQNVKRTLNGIDGDYFQGYNRSYITLNFGDNLNVSQGARLVIRADEKPHPRSIHVQVQDSAGNWNTVAAISPRAFWSTDVIDMSQYLPDAKGNLKVRLYFTAKHKLDFVALDTSPHAPVQVHPAELISAIRQNSGEDATAKLSFADEVYAKLLPGQGIELRFSVPNKTQCERHFILISNGHYYTLTSSPVPSPDVPDPPVPKWREWFDLIAKNCREKGWIWANVVGHPFYYVSNTNKFSDLVPIGPDGLKRYLRKDIVPLDVYRNNGTRLYDLDRQGFRSTYSSLPSTVQIYKTFSKDADIPWDAFDYYYPTDPSYATVAITMNATIMNLRTYPGIFVHSGVGADVNRNGADNDVQDDWLKGYIATALAIEEARSLISWPTVLTEVLGNTHAAAFAASISVGDWGRDHDGSRTYRFIRLKLSVGAHYDYYQQSVFPYSYYNYLSQADFEISGGVDTYLSIDLDDSGIDTGRRDATLMNDIGWWTEGTLVGAIQGYGLILGPAIGMIPIVINYFQPVNPQYTGDHIWAKEIAVDPDNDDRGTAALTFEIRFYGTEGQGGDTQYSFNIGMASWRGVVATNILTGKQTDAPRGDDISYSMTLTFTVRWGIIT